MERTGFIQECIAELRARPAPLLLLRGRPDAGHANAVRAILNDLPHLLFRANPLSEVENRTELWTRLLASQDAEVVGSDAPDWNALLEWIAERTRFARQPFVLAIEEVEHLVAADRTFFTRLGRTWSRIRDRGDPFRLLLSTRTVEMSTDSLLDQVGAEGVSDRSLRPLTYLEAGRRFPGWSPRDRILLSTTIGGDPDRVALFNPDRGLRANLERTLFHPNGRLHDLPIREILSEFQTPTRFVGILRALARGARRWREVVAEMPELQSSNQIAPYVRKLEKHGLVQAARPLDAAPGSRNRRYRLADPLYTYWLRFVLPHRSELYEDTSRMKVVERVLWPCLDRQAEAEFGRICMEFLQHHCADSLGANARQIGGLWSSDPEIPIAGILRNGAAVYGAVHWGRHPAGPKLLQLLTLGMRGTRYGFTKERRYRVLFSASGFTHECEREAARSTGVRLIGMEELNPGSAPD